MSFDGNKLFNLLPSLYRLRDAQLAQAKNLTLGPLQSLLAVIAEQLAAVEDDLDQLYDDQFIETCAPWVIPYIGDLIGYQSVHGIAPAVASPRAEVANTISFRRRKGTILVMEQLARDVTGWGAHAVEFFKLLADTQYMNHIRLDNLYSPDLRQWQPLAYQDGAFDGTAHKVDVRRISEERGKYNLQNIGIFLWSLGSYSLTQAPAAPSEGNPPCFRFNPLGADLPLFNFPVSQGSPIQVPAVPQNVPDRLLRHVLCQDIQDGVGAVYYGEGNSLAVYFDGKVVNAYQIRVCDLSGAEGAWANLPAAGSPYAVAIDPELGRLALAPPAGGTYPEVRVSFHYGFNAELGGGEYPRAAGFVVQDEDSVLPFPDTKGLYTYGSDLQKALTFAATQLASGGEIAVEIADSGTYAVAGAAGVALEVQLPAGTTLEIRAAEECRPTLILGGEMTVAGGASSILALNGLVISSSAAPNVPAPVALVHAIAEQSDGTPNALGELSLVHCTLVPGWTLGPDGTPAEPAEAALLVEPAGIAVSVARSILGAVRTGKFATVSAADSILDATATTQVAYSGLDGNSGGGALTLVGCTVVGKVHATLLTLVSNSIVFAERTADDLVMPPGPQAWPAALWADRKQEGCVRFSWYPANSIVPREFKCVEGGSGAANPLFTCLRYGQPAYGQLSSFTDPSVRQGADDSGEMGAFHFLLAPLRETDLRVRMNEYLPVGMEFGIFYQT